MNRPCEVYGCDVPRASTSTKYCPRHRREKDAWLRDERWYDRQEDLRRRRAWLLETFDRGAHDQTLWDDPDALADQLTIDADDYDEEASA